MVYQHPTNSQFSVRVSPGYKKAQYKHQKKPYVVHHTDKGCLNKNGNSYVSDNTKEAHFPLKKIQL